MHTSQGPISFIFMQFSGKFCQIIGWRPHLTADTQTLGNPGSATSDKKKAQLLVCRVPTFTGKIYYTWKNHGILQKNNKNHGNIMEFWQSGNVGTLGYCGNDICLIR